MTDQPAEPAQEILAIVLDKPTRAEQVLLAYGLPVTLVRVASRPTTPTPARTSR